MKNFNITKSKAKTLLNKLEKTKETNIKYSLEPRRLVKITTNIIAGAYVNIISLIATIKQ